MKFRPSMTTSKVIERRLRAVGDPERAKHSLRFFRTGPGEYGEGDRFLGLTVPEIRAVAREFKDAPLDALAGLLQSPWHEVRLTALVILVAQYRRGDDDLRDAIYRLYLESTDRINNWDLVDVSAADIVGAHLRDRRAEARRSTLDRLARSASLWERRIAIIATQHFIRRDEFADTLRIAAILADDEHDLIHKAVGWMLREVGTRDQKAEEVFLRRYASRMPRTMLRYAIERFPERLRKQYLTWPATSRRPPRRS
jgi:3-methyladenine DNA glycosylase AlkD